MKDALSVENASTKAENVFIYYQSPKPSVFLELTAMKHKLYRHLVKYLVLIVLRHQIQVETILKLPL